MEPQRPPPVLRVSDYGGSNDDPNGNSNFPRLWLNLVLHCTSNGREMRSKVQCVGELETATVQDLKNRIENQHKIPSFLQRLYCEATLLESGDATLAENWVREGDTIRVEYSTVADIDEIMEVIQILLQVTNATRKELEREPGSEVAAPDPVFAGDMTGQIRHLLFTHCSNPSKRSEANRLFFNYHQGIHLLIILYKLVIDSDYASNSFHIRHLESILIQAIGSVVINPYSRIPILQKWILETPILEYSLRSFTRVVLQRGRRVIAPVGCRDRLPIPGEMQDQVLAMSLDYALVNLSK